MYFCEYFSKYTGDVYISDTTKAVICGSVLLFGIVYFSTRDSSNSLSEKEIDNLISEKYGIHTETDYSSLLNFKLVNFRIKRDNTHVDSDETLLNFFHPHLRALLSPEDHMIQELNGVLYCLLYDAKSFLNFQLPLFIFFSLTCISFINYYAFLLMIEKQKSSAIWLHKERVRKAILLRETLLKEVRLREILPKETLFKEALSREALAREALAREALVREALLREVLSREELLRERYLKYKITTGATEINRMESIDIRLTAIKSTRIELKRILAEKILLKKSIKK